MFLLPLVAKKACLLQSLLLSLYGLQPRAIAVLETKTQQNAARSIDELEIRKRAFVRRTFFGCRVSRHLSGLQEKELLFLFLEQSKYQGETCAAFETRRSLLRSLWQATLLLLLLSLLQRPWAPESTPSSLKHTDLTPGSTPSSMQGAYRL